MSHPLFEIVTTTAGAVSIRNKVVNEIMHNPVGPWAEANALYIEQSKLRDRLRRTGDVKIDAEEFVLFDVGLGAAANALAVLACVHGLGDEARPFRMISFEREMELLKFALEHSAEFAHFKGYEPALQTLLETGKWSAGQVHWELRQGDFLELIDAEPFKANMIYFDPYSPKVNQDMWGASTFRKLRAKARSAEEGGASLYTYSQATRIRVAMMHAGFFVGYGSSTGLKAETTEASTDILKLKSPLGRPWKERWKKSHLRYPFDCAPENEASTDEFVEAYFNSDFFQKSATSI